jgi:hypothetical protein
MARNKAVNAAGIALRGDGSQMGLARQGDQDDAGNRRLPEDQIHGDLARRPSGERHRVLTQLWVGSAH